jgi:hypothetical protein
MTDEQFMWMLRATLPPPTPEQVFMAGWERSKGKPFLARLRLSLSTKWIAETLAEIRPPLGPWPTGGPLSAAKIIYGDDGQPVRPMAEVARGLTKKDQP